MDTNSFTLRNVIIPSVNPRDRWDLEVAGKQHIHLDKAYLLTSNHPPSSSIPSYSDLAPVNGDFQEALAKSHEAKYRFTPEDLDLRGRQLIADCYRHGVTSMRAFVEVDTVTQFKTLEAAIRLKKEFAHLVRVQICVFAQGPLFSRQDGLENRKVLARALDGYAGDIEALGTTPYVEADEYAALDNIRWAIQNAMDRGLFLDFHLDYHLKSSAGAGKMMIKTVLKSLVEMRWTTRWTTAAYKGKQAVAIGHCTRLTTLTSSELREIQTQINEHRLPIHFVGLPTSDLLMMGRPQLPPPPPPSSPGQAGGTTTTVSATDDDNDDDNDDDGSTTPFSRPRGTLQVISMIRDWGLNACLGVNNVGNPFTPHGTGDPLQLACWGVGLYHAGTAADAELLYGCVSGRARRAVGLDDAGEGEEGDGEEGGRRVVVQGLGPVMLPCPGLLVENSAFDELPAPGAGAGAGAGAGTADVAAGGDSILVPSRRRLGVKDVVWDPPASRRIVRY